ncbi:MAG: N-formylglutamate amidohydrolase [Hyphomicrobiales bacterium]
MKQVVASSEFGEVAQVVNPAGNHAIVLVCEHASNYIPERLDGLGLAGDVLTRHIAWDIGAMETASIMAELLDAPLVSSKISRLVYDCNRPPEAHDAMPANSEIYSILGNQNLNDEQKSERIKGCYLPFEQLLSDVLDKGEPHTVLITMHSFTPVYKGEKRAVEVGILHDVDDRFALALKQVAAGYDIRLNEPYGQDDGVTHTLAHHAVKRGILNVMLEIRSDLITTSDQCAAMAEVLVGWIKAAVQAGSIETSRKVAQ